MTSWKLRDTVNDIKLYGIQLVETWRSMDGRDSIVAQRTRWLDEIRQDELDQMLNRATHGAVSAAPRG